jgi:Tol biopolymer transport system component
MPDTKRWIGEVRRVRPPELWEEVERRVARGEAPQEKRSRRGLQTVAILAVALAVVGTALYALHDLGSTSSFEATSTLNGAIAFVQTDDPGHGPWRIETIDPVSGQISDLTSTAGGFADPAWSPDGSRLAYTVTIDAVSTIHVMNGDGSDQHELDPCGPPECLSDVSPTWSPDGSTIAYARTSGAGATVPEAIFTAHAETGANRELIGLPGMQFVTQLAWSPDGNTIAFAASPVGPSKHFFIYVVGSDGSGLHRLTDAAGQDTSPSWSPDESQIVFVRDSDIYVMNSDGSNVRELYSCLPTCVSAYEPAWSADGKQIAFSEQFGEQRDLFVMDADGTNPRRLTDTPADEFEPAWQPLPQARVTPSPSPSASAPAPLTRGAARGDPTDGIWLLTPPDWSFLVHPSGPDEPKTLFAIASYPIERGGECAPTQALEALPADGGLAWVIEYQDTQGNDFPPRPDRFSLDPSSLAAYECSGIHASYMFRFQDAGRYFQVHVAFGDRANDEVRNEMLASLSSLVVDRCPPAEGPVLVSEFGTLSPDHGSAGDLIGLSGPTGRDENWFWSPLDTIEVWWSSGRNGVPHETSDQHLLATIDPGSSCSFKTEFRVPNVSPGRYLITVLFYEPGGGYGVAAERAFTVTG